MFQTINTFITSLSLGLFCIAVNLYVDLHLGYEFVSLVIALELAVVLVAIALNKNIKNLNVDTISLVAVVSLITSAYLLFAIDFTTTYSYFIAFLCLILPVVLVAVFLISGSEKNSLGYILTAEMLIASSAGFFSSLAIACYLYNWQSIWGIFMLSLLALTIVITLRKDTAVVIKVSALCLLIGIQLSLKNNFDMQLANWSLFDKPVSKYSLNKLNNLEESGWLVEKTNLKNSSRVDIVTTRHSRGEGGFWTIHDANIQVPFVLEVNSSASWWSKHYPLMIFPFEFKAPSTVLTISSVRGVGVDISQQFYNAKTTSVYSDCFTFNDANPCDNSALNTKLEAALSADKHYDLVLFSIYNQIITPYVGVSSQYETIHTTEVFQKLYDSLNDNGLLAINASNQTLLRKTLSYVWRVLSDSDEDKIISFEKNIRVLALNKYNIKNDAYNYLVLVSKGGFTSEELQKINSLVKSKPVAKMIYGTARNNLPDGLTVSSAIAGLAKLSSRDFKKIVSLQPSSIVKPNYFHLTKTLHPFTSVLSAFFLFLGLYGLVFSHAALRKIGTAIDQRGPGLAKILTQVFLTAVSFVFVLYTIVLFTSASLGYSSQYVALLIIFSLTAFSIPYVSMSAGFSVLRGINGLWLYLASILLCVLILLIMNQKILILFSTEVQAVIFILTVLYAFCSGLLHRQTIIFIKQLYPSVNFWFWCMTSIGVVLGVIIAKYILINYNLEIIIQTAICLLLFMAFIAWWGFVALRDRSRFDFN